MLVTATYDVTSAVQSWYDEVQYYTYDSLSCAPQKACGHYTQVKLRTSVT
jgi:pathogenesis-related protein 1